MPAASLQHLKTFIRSGVLEVQKIRLEIRDKCLEVYQTSTEVSAEALALALRCMQPNFMQDEPEYGWDDARLFKLTLQRNDLVGLRLMLELHPNTFKVNQILDDTFSQDQLPTLIIVDPAADPLLVFPNYSLNYIPSVRQAIEAWVFYSSKPQKFGYECFIAELLERLLDITAYRTPIEGFEAACAIYTKILNLDPSIKVKLLPYTIEPMEKVSQHFENHILKSLKSESFDWTLQCLEKIDAVAPLLPIASKMYLMHKASFSQAPMIQKALLFKLIQKNILHEREISFLSLCKEAFLQLSYTQLNELLRCTEKVEFRLYQDTLFFLILDKTEKNIDVHDSEDPTVIMLRAENYIKTLDDYSDIERLTPVLAFLTETVNQKMRDLGQEKSPSIGAFLN